MRGLRPAPFIAEKLRELDTYLRGEEGTAAAPTSGAAAVSVVGVHFRAHMEQYDWKIVPPRSELTVGGSASPPSAVFFNESAMLHHFEEAMWQMWGHAKAAAETGRPARNVRFLFVSNDEAAKQHMLQTFGNRYVCVCVCVCVSCGVGGAAKYVHAIDG